MDSSQKCSECGKYFEHDMCFLHMNKYLCNNCYDDTEVRKIVKTLSDFVGNKTHTEYYWNPMADWNHWRQVEEKVMEDEELWLQFMQSFNPHPAAFVEYMKADLSKRCRCLVSILDS